MFDLPEHLSSLNALSASPSNPPMDAAAEDAVWHYLNTDELFRNFGVQPSELAAKEEAEKKPSPADPPADLKSFVEQFVNESSASYTPDFPVRLLYNNGSTPAISTSDIMPQAAAAADTPGDDDDRPLGAKRLKQLGAGQAEIEEDKRRRNTEASARFRAKKKEREQTLERRAKELEAQVSRLQADKASLENENRLLKAIVLSGNAGQSTTAPDAIAQLVGDKRKRA